jgi:NAD(P)-dependent dehydrogenase (short-subunit alcohol dehydrogenase family)
MSNTNPHEMPEDNRTRAPQSRGLARRDLLKAPLALAAGAVISPWLSGESRAKEDKKPKASIAPNYYPLKKFKPEIKLKNKLAVITGASRGIGRAVGESLSALNVDVIGTSRDPAGVPDPPDFPLLTLDIADPGSVFAFVGELASHPLFQEHGQVDILVNNAARITFGRIVPDPSYFAEWLAQRDLGMQTTYSGHVTVTNAVLPLMPQQGYSRIIYTVSIAGYITAAQLPIGSFQDVYGAGKNALRVYANNLDTALQLAGSSIRISTVNPYFVNTTGMFGANPIYTQPVNEDGLSPDDSLFNDAITFVRALQANGLPASMVGETYAQLLSMVNPDQNVVVASPRGTLAEQGANAIIEPEILAENAISAVPFV